MIVSLIRKKEKTPEVRIDSLSFGDWFSIPQQTGIMLWVSKCKHEGFITALKFSNTTTNGLDRFYFDPSTTVIKRDTPTHIEVTL